MQKFSFPCTFYATGFHGVGIFVHVYKTAKLVEYNLPHEVPYINHMHSRVHSAVPAHNNATHSPT